MRNKQLTALALMSFILLSSQASAMRANLLSLLPGLALLASSANAMIVLLSMVPDSGTPSTQVSSETYYVGDSKIHGKGVMAARPLKGGEIIGEGIKYENALPVVSNLGAWINHSSRPTAKLVRNEELKKWDIVAAADMEPASEITVNYDETPWFIERAQPHYR